MTAKLKRFVTNERSAKAERYDRLIRSTTLALRTYRYLPVLWGGIVFEIEAFFAVMQADRDRVQKP